MPESSPKVRRALPLNRHLVALVLGSMIPIALFSSVVIYRLLVSERGAGERRLLRTSRELSAAVDTEITATIRTLEVLAQSSSLQAGDLATFHTEVMRVQKTQPAWLAVIVHSAEGMPLLNSRRAFGSVLQTQDPESLAEVLIKRQPLVGFLKRGDGGQMGFAVRMPVTIDGAFRSVLTVVVSAAALQKLVESSLPEQGEWTRTIVDPAGTVSARSRDPEKFVGSSTTKEYITRMRNTVDTDLSRSVTLDGQEVYSAMTRAPVSQWVSSIAVPVAVLEAPAKHSMIAVAGVGLLLLISFGALAFAYSQHLARRINAAALAADAIARGESPRIPPSRVLEVEKLRKALFAAAELLAARNSERDELLVTANAARVEAEDAGEAKDKFLAMLGHELRNPLGAVSNGVFLLRDLLPKTEEINELQDIIERQVGHLNRMIDELLDASRISRGKVTLTCEPLDLRVALQETRADFSPTYGEEDRQLTLSVPDSPVWVAADRTRLNQCFANLLQNSLKFTREGGRVTISLEAKDGEAVVQVTDDGVGIDHDLLQTLFQPFQQGPQSFDRRTGGLGLGLAVVKGLVQLHGGTVEARSEGKDLGTVMRITLPTIPAPEAPAKALPTAAAKPAKARRILIVEDIEDAAKSLQRILVHKGHDVRIATNGVDGIEQAQVFRPDAIICDLGLPDIDGNEVCRRILSMLGDHPPQMIALSGYAQESDIRNSHAAGFQHHLSKPVDFEKLAAILG